MIKVILKRVPKKTDHSAQHEIMKQWSATMVETHSQKCNIEIISAKELSRNKKNQSLSPSDKANK